MKKILFTVTNDLNFDQRMIRICSTLKNEGYDILLIGRSKKSSPEIHPRNFDQYRLKCIFEKGKLFYIEYNIRLFFYLLFHSFDAICSIDLDTVLPGLFIAKLKRKIAVFDAHELFTEVPELNHRPRVKKIWQKVERFAIKRIQYAYTVCESLQDQYLKTYNTKFEVIRNVPFPISTSSPNAIQNTFTILYQGVLNEGRGIEQMIEAMIQLKDCQLWLAGEGDLSNELREMVNTIKLNDRVKFLGYIKPDELREITHKTHIGINLLRNESLNYYFSLANKFFDYLQAGKPSINMNFPEYASINAKYKVSLLLDDLEADTIVNAVNCLKNDPDYYQTLKENCIEAAKVFNWDIESKKLLQFYHKLFNP